MSPPSPLNPTGGKVKEEFNTNQGSGFANWEFTQVPQDHGVRNSMDWKTTSASTTDLGPIRPWATGPRPRCSTGSRESES